MSATVMMCLRQFWYALIALLALLMTRKTSFRYAPDGLMWKLWWVCKHHWDTNTQICMV